MPVRSQHEYPRTAVDTFGAREIHIGVAAFVIPDAHAMTAFRFRVAVADTFSFDARFARVAFGRSAAGRARSSPIPTVTAALVLRAHAFESANTLDTRRSRAKIAGRRGTIGRNATLLGTGAVAAHPGAPVDAGSSRHSAHGAQSVDVSQAVCTPSRATRGASMDAPGQTANESLDRGTTRGGPRECPRQGIESPIVHLAHFPHPANDRGNTDPTLRPVPGATSGRILARNALAASGIWTRLATGKSRADRAETARFPWFAVPGWRRLIRGLSISRQPRRLWCVQPVQPYRGGHL